MHKKNIIITGVSRGIGFELLKLLVEEGHQVLGISRNKKTLKSLVEEKENLTFMSLDISEEKALDSVADFVKNNWKRVDVLVHNAGALIHKPLEETTISDFEAIYKVNVFGVAGLTRVLIPFLATGSHVVAISSMGGVQGSVKFPGLSAYSSSKGAVITLMELLAEEFKDRKIACNTLAIGAVQTAMLEAAFPEYKAPLTALEMATYVKDFALTGHHFYNGKTLQVSSSTP